jgi:transcriptional regulator with XRE-family HTH domain
VTGLDGPTLRAVRESIGVPLRRIARQAGMSHGHLSKVERGEHGRPVTPAILSAYERVTGVKLAEAAATVAERRDRDTGRRGKSWRPGQLTDMRRRGYNAAIGAITIGGHLGEPVSRLIDSTGRPITPTPPELVDVAQLEQVTDLLTGLDLRYGGGLVSQLSKALLRWAVVMLDAVGMADPVPARLNAAVSALALRAAWSAFDVAAHEAARSLFRLALYTAARAQEPSLRAHVLAEVAAQHNQLGYHQDALEVVRLGEGDERVSPGVRMVLHGVKARVYAATGAADERQVGLAEEAFELADEAVTGWVGSLRHPGLLYAVTGHAVAELAVRDGSEADARDAQRRLARAIDALDPTTHARSRALCTIKLALLCLWSGELEQGASWARLGVLAATGITSARLAREVAVLREAADARADAPEMRALVACIDDVTGAGEVAAGDAGQVGQVVAQTRSNESR